MGGRRGVDSGREYFLDSDAGVVDADLFFFLVGWGICTTGSILRRGCWV